MVEVLCCLSVRVHTTIDLEMSYTDDGMCLTVTVSDTDTVQHVKEKYAKHAGCSPEDIHITYCEIDLHNDDHLHKHGISPGDLHLVSLGQGQHPITKRKVVILAAATTKHPERVDRIIVTSKDKPTNPDLVVQTIRLSCESHRYDPSKEHNYAGFILYAWENDDGVLLEDWRLNGKHCKSAYLVIQGTDSPDVRRYIGKAPGQVHGAVYWNVFGEGADVSRAVGEGFSIINGEYQWTTGVFNARHDAYRGSRREISALAKKCVKQIVNDWKRTSQVGKTCEPCAGKTYSVEKLLSKTTCTAYTDDGMCLTVTVSDTDTVQRVKEKYAKHAGCSPEDIHITYSEIDLHNDDHLHKHGISPGDLHLVSLGQGQHPVTKRKVVILAAATTKHPERVDRIIVTSKDKPTNPDLVVQTIRLSCESHRYDPSKEHNYAGFILYGWENDDGVLLEDWRLNGKHCKSAYLVIQGTDSPDVRRYMRPPRKAPGIAMHGAVYWNVFGEGADVKRAVGEGFAIINKEYQWTSGTFNAKGDAYHGSCKQISALAKKCVKQIVNDWKRTSQVGKTCEPCAGKTYSVEKLLSMTT